jgi:hypothetical protein
MEGEREMDWDGDEGSGDEEESELCAGDRIIDSPRGLIRVNGRGY